jgi:FMN-dependent NADH-azoreductase
MKILRISCSPRGREGESHKLSEKIIRSLSERSNTTSVIDRMIGLDPVPHIDRAYVMPLSAMYPGSSGSIERSEELVRELDGADVLVLATPMHNLGMPSALKAWIDHVVRAGRTFQVTPEGKVGGLRDRPVFLAIASGGRFSGAHARQPDFLTPHLKAVLGTIGLHDVTIFTIEGTGFGLQILEEGRHEADRKIRAHVSSLQLGHLDSR